MVCVSGDDIEWRTFDETRYWYASHLIFVSSVLSCKIWKFAILNYTFYGASKGNYFSVSRIFNFFPGVEASFLSTDEFRSFGYSLKSFSAIFERILITAR